MGRLGSLRPARARRMASATACTASSCPTTRWWSRSSSCRSFCISPSSSRVTGIPVHLLTTSAMSSASTSSFRSRCGPRARSSASAASSCLASSGRVPYRRRAARSRSATRSACSSSTFVRSICSLMERIRCTICFSRSQRWRRASLSWRRRASSCSSFSNRSRDAGSVSRRSASRSISNCMIRRSISSSSAGLLSISIRSLAAASSMRSMALSGRKRSLMYRWDRVAAAITAASVIRTPWWTSYFSLSPRRMEMVSSTDGSPTYTGWKRRSRAGSFSMCFRYSSRVVAPMQWSSPRASMGLRMLAASMAAPSAAPAPTTVWISSMKRMISPWLSAISFRTALSRSSNSPRYLVPATRAPRSSWNTRLRLSCSGTSPRTMRCASPSTMAVLPTPGSPMSTGLFFVRRLRTWMTRRISSSRPITGSSLPARASSVRSRP
ncbi:hypothetical protein HRbin32_01368 [bacterium HR32]|nr:hypothetical protein HRbin32_01368 [bacterium HR32]